jgi:uncharacterized protein (TIGR00730 family)
VKRICVFCGSSAGRSPKFAEAARALGNEMARRGIGLVYGGGNVGLMGIVADAVLDGKGEAIGVIPRGLVARELAHRGLSRLEIVETMHERKQRMHDLSDGFVALPGGFGTLDELFEALTWAQLGVHEKPIALFDVEEFWQPLVTLVEHQVQAGLLRPEHAATLLRASTVAEMFAVMEGYRAPQLAKWIDRKGT